MSTLWLRSIDGLSRFAPSRSVVTGRFFGTIENVCVLRPGGLGDLVVLTRAALNHGIDLSALCWIVERRNAPWAEFLRLPFVLYDHRADFLSLLRGKRRFHVVINSEQFHGLATLFAARLVRPGGKIVGFGSNPRADYFDEQIPYNPRELSAFAAFQALFASAAGPLLRTGSSFIPPLDRSVVPTDQARYRVVALGGLQARERTLGVEDWRRVVVAARGFRGVDLPVLLVGAPADRRFAEVVCDGCPGVQNLVGALPFPTVVQTLRSAERLFGVDSGLLHVADFFDVPTSGIYFSELKRLEWPLAAPDSEMVTFAEFARLPAAI